MRRICALLVAFFLIYSVSSGDPAWDSPNISAKQGQTVLTHCLIKGVEPLRVVRLYRTVGDTEYPISDNGQLKPAYVATHRYSVTYVYANMIASVTLVISGILGDDSGTIGCYKLGSSQKSILTIDVDVPFADLYILARHPDGSEYAVEGRQTVTLTADHYNVLSCVALVNGSTAAISMTLTVGGQNEISLFESTSDSHVADMHNGFIARSSFHKLLYASTDPPGRFNGKTLVCTATKTEDGAHVMSVEVDLNVYYKPTVTCSQAQYVTALGKPLKIECEVSSNPGSTIEWLDGETRAVVQSDNTVRIDEQAVNAERVRVTLSVDVVNNKQPLKYVLKATNDVGVRQLPISVYVDGLSPTTAVVVPSTATPPPTVRVNHGNKLESGQPQAAAASNDAATLRGTVAVVSSFFVTTFFLLIAPTRC